MFTVSGVRGIVGDSMTPEVALNLSTAFGTWLRRGSVVVGRDTRPSGDMLQRAVTAGLTSTGHDVIDVGVTPSPAVAYTVKTSQAVGGVIVSASHNPPEWNALKFLGTEGISVSESDVQAIGDRYTRGAFNYASWTSLGKVYPRDVTDTYIAALIRNIDVEAVKRSALSVVVDPGNGAGSLVTPYLLREVGCHVTTLNASVDGFFSRPLEPTREALGDLARLVVALKADVGFAHDCDADRLVCVDDKGEVMPEDIGLAVIVDDFLRRSAGGVFVTNVASSLMFEDIAEKHGVKVVRTRVGEAYVAQKMVEVKALIGGEGSCGGIIMPQIHAARDGVLAAAKVTEILAKRGVRLSELVLQLPRYHSARGKVACSGVDAERAVKALKERYRGKPLDLTDGVKVHGRGEWVLVRPSGTEPVIRVMAEAKTPGRAQELCDRFLSEVSAILALKKGET